MTSWWEVDCNPGDDCAWCIPEIVPKQNTPKGFNFLTVGKQTENAAPSCIIIAPSPEQEKLTFVRIVKKGLVAVTGTSLFIVGTVMLFTPLHHPGHVVQAGGLWILAKEYRAPKILLQWIGEMTDRQIGFVCKLLKKCLNSLEPALLKLSKVTDQKLSSIRKTCSTLKERFRKKSRVPSPRIGQTVELESLI